ncbi:DUF262 domain-containing protein [Leptotrichia sp. oral taxon 221]|uniref:DUF262 domain-containing protein n=1 Tax=Leptotrichia sp. oral taxon 221 TaxID=712362 RepID=UPI001B8B37AC|nr:DUF262 domain-containing protein [Leptotrichia sp. oral taxon 221]QUB96892.1 DUF262 domain-containing protein [Leptotrichia sp. oral taxon 221]
MMKIEQLNVKQFLETGREEPFLVPDYQRPYSWGEEEIVTLFNDLLLFTEGDVSKKNKNSNDTYFLGTVISFKNENGEQEIIDGQQRITSLFLLLRAIYTKLKTFSKKTNLYDELLSEIEPILWKNVIKSEGAVKNVLISSSVINDEGNNILKGILENGVTKEEANDRYSLNYTLFQRLFDGLVYENPGLMFEFVRYVLNRTLICPIITESQEGALNIFSTLNTRGMPLSESDIFKAKIYNFLDDSQKNRFIERWKELTEKAEYVNEDIQQIFYYYMFYLRALDGDSATTTIGIRKYFSQNNFAKLFNKSLLKDLNSILDLWAVVVKKQSLENAKWSKNNQIIKMLDVLSSYPNEFWKYPVIIYYLVHKENPEFEKRFLKFLKKLTIELVANYLVKPTVLAVKAGILKLNVEITKKLSPPVTFQNLPLDSLKTKLRLPSKNLFKMTLKMMVYNFQEELLPDKWEIEQIYPSKSVEGFNNEALETVSKDYLDSIGNKIPFEKRSTIKASKDYFQKKRILYLRSQIPYVKEFATKHVTHWNVDDIKKRNEFITEEIMRLFISWSGDYEF